MRQLLTTLPMIAVLAGCATGEPVSGAGDPDVAEIAQALNCAPGEYAVCVDTSCEPEEYVCAPKGDFRKIYEPRIRY